MKTAIALVVIAFVGGVGVGRLSVGTTLSGEGPLGQAQSEVANVTVQDLEGRTKYTRNPERGSP